MENINKQKFSPKDENLKSKVTENAPYISPTPGEIPIIAITAFGPNKVIEIKENTDPSKQLITKEDLVTLKDCGFNVASEAIDHWYGTMNLYLNLFKDSGIGFMPFTRHILTEYFSVEEVVDYLNYYKNATEIVAWNYKDEPLYADLLTLAADYENLIEWDPGRMFLINLYAWRAVKYIGPYNTSLGDAAERAYVKYLEKFQDLFRPAVWSYDFYPIVKDSNNSIRVETEMFYNNLNYFKTISIETNRPFWAFCQSQEFTRNLVGDGCPAPKEEYLRYEAFSALAYGAQGILYWTYAQRKNTNSETYGSALFGPLENGTLGKTIVHAQIKCAFSND